MMICNRIFCVLLAGLLCLPVTGQTRRRVDRSTDALALLPAATGLVLTVCKKDMTGLKQLALGSTTGLAANYLLELAVKKDRPDGTGSHAFPSTHTTVSFAGAAFLQRRYGWKWGIPAYLVSAYVGWGRIYAKKHDIWDVLAGAAIGAGAGYLYTRPLARKAQLSVAPAVVGAHPGIYLSARF